MNDLFIYLIKIFFSTIEYSSVILLALSLFRVPYKYKITKIVLIALIVSIVSYYFRDYFNDIAIPSLLIVLIVLIMLAFNLVIFYSMLICIIGLLGSAIVETLVFVLGSKLGITSEDLMKNSIWHLSIVQLSTAIILLIVVYFLQSKKIGFMFIAKHLAIRQALKGYNFILSIILVISIVCLQLAIDSYKENSFHIYFPIILAIAFISGIWISYKHNKEILKLKDERLSKK
jgi:hypothetical protein